MRGDWSRARMLSCVFRGGGGSKRVAETADRQLRIQHPNGPLSAVEEDSERLYPRTCVLANVLPVVLRGPSGERGRLKLRRAWRLGWERVRLLLRAVPPSAHSCIVPKLVLELFHAPLQARYLGTHARGALLYQRVDSLCELLLLGSKVVGEGLRALQLFGEPTFELAGVVQGLVE